MSGYLCGTSDTTPTVPRLRRAPLHVARPQRHRPGPRLRAPAFDDAADLAVIGWSDAVHAGGELELATARKLLAAHFEDGAVVELTVCATATLMLNRYATSLALPISPQTLSRLASEGLAR